MFNKISNIKYDINRNGKLIESKNIFRFAYILDLYKDNPKNYTNHRIEQNQTIEQIAEKFYGDSSYSWIVMMYNNLLDVYEELPKSQQVLRNFIAKKYLPKNVMEAKRIISLPTLSTGGETVAGNYHGQIIYNESSNQGLIWNANSGTGNWNPIGGFGVPDPSPRTFEITCNNLVEPEKSTSWLIDGKNDPDILLVRGGVYTFKIHYSPEDNFYTTTDKGSNWNQYDYYGSYIENQNESLLSQGHGRKTITFTVPKDAPDVLYYMSQKTRPYPLNDLINSAEKKMTGIIRIVNQEDVAYVVGTDKNSLQTKNGRIMGNIAKIKDTYYVWNGKYYPPNSTNFVSGWDRLNPESQQEESYTTSLGLLTAAKTPHKFTHISNKTEISPATYSLMGDSEKSKFSMTSKFDYEEEKNEKNRNIRIMKQELLGDFLKDWEKVIA